MIITESCEVVCKDTYSKVVVIPLLPPRPIQTHNPHDIDSSNKKGQAVGPAAETRCWVTSTPAYDPRVRTFERHFRTLCILIEREPAFRVYYLIPPYCSRK